jgi:hypothetical protein
MIAITTSNSIKVNALRHSTVFRMGFSKMVKQDRQKREMKSIDFARTMSALDGAMWTHSADHAFFEQTSDSFNAILN